MAGGQIALVESSGGGRNQPGAGALGTPPARLVRHEERNLRDAIRVCDPDRRHPLFCVASTFHDRDMAWDDSSAGGRCDALRIVYAPLGAGCRRPALPPL